jgi:hypothetical protein
MLLPPGLAYHFYHCDETLMTVGFGSRVRSKQITRRAIMKPTCHSVRVWTAANSWKDRLQYATRRRYDSVACIGPMFAGGASISYRFSRMIERI